MLEHRQVYLGLIWLACCFYTSETKLDCSALLYGAKEVANGIAYKGGIMWGGCSGDSSVGETNVEVAFYDSDNIKILSKTVDVIKDQYSTFDVAVPTGACVVGKELTLQLDLSGLDTEWTPLETQLKCMDNSNVLLVQMNKPLYKPGDSMKAQIFCLERENTGNCENVEIKVHIVNPQGTMMNVQEYTFGTGANEKLVAEYLYRVDQKPVLGQYCLNIEPKSAEISAKTVEKCFDIEEYVLPTFESEISFDQGAIIISNVGSITGSMKATYTYGQPVATAHFQLKCWMDEDNVIFDDTFSEDDLKTFTIDGEVIQRALNKYQEEHWGQNAESLKCVLNAAESSAAGLPTQTSEATISVEEKEIIVECCDTFSCPEIVRPGKYSTCLTVRYADGSNFGDALDSDLVLSVIFKQCGRADQQALRETTEVIIGQRNEFTFTAEEKSTEKDTSNYPLCNSWMPVYSLKALVHGKSASTNAKSLTYSPDLSEYHSEVNSYLSVDVCDSEALFEANKDACVEVNLVPEGGRSDVTTIMVIIKSRGVVREVKTESVSSFPHQIQVPISPEMTPNFVVFVSAMANDTEQSDRKEVLPASVTIPVEQNARVLPNQVSLEPSPPANGQFYSPGDTVGMQVTTSASDSIVALIGLDKRMVAAAGKANIIQLDDVVEALASGGGSTDDGGDSDDPIIIFCWRPLPSTSTDADSTIKDAGLVYLVSGNYRVPSKPDVYYGMIFDFKPIAVAEEAVPRIMFKKEPVRNTALLARAPMSSSFSLSVPPALKVRKSFPEVTLFQLASSAGSSNFSVDIDLGDTLTTHIVHASAISPTVGFGTVFQPEELRVFKEVSSNMQTPYAMKRYESFNASITACNYKKEDLEVSLEILFNPEEFYDITKNVTGGDSCTDQLTALASQECKVFQCPFEALQMGNSRMGLELSAKTKSQSNMQVYDRLVKKIKVKPEGCENEYSLRTVELHAGEEHVFKINVSDADAVDRSGIAHVSLYSSLTAPALQNPEQLVRMPMGCGEQTMTLLAPLIYLKMILLAGDQSLSVEKELLLQQYMESGYNRELKYKHPDGSFSAFGTSDDSGSTWLTAFVAKTFSEAKNGGYIDIDSNVLLDAYRFMLSSSVFDKQGKVVEVGRVIHTEMQGGSTGADTMTAYHLLSLSQMPGQMFNEQLTSSQRAQFDDLLSLVKNVIDDAADASVANNYLLCLGGNAVFDALSMKGVDASADVVLEKVRVTVSNSVSGGCGRSYWTNEEPTSESECECAPEEQLHMYVYTSAVKKVANKVEITGYCLAFLSKMDSDYDTLVRQKAMSWLGCQQSDYGGFSTTQNTVTGFYGLATNAAASEATDLSITVTDSYGNVTDFSMDDSLEVFKYEYTNVPNVKDGSITVKVEAAAGGGGKIYASGILYYNTKSCSSAGKDPKIEIEAVVKDPQDQSIKVYIVMKYTGEDAGNMGMGIIEVECLSGFAFTEDSIAEVLKVKEVKRGEIDSEICKLNIYLDDVPEVFRLTVTLVRVEPIAGQQGATVMGGSYYNPMVKSSALYNSEALSGGDIFRLCNDCVTNAARNFGALKIVQISLLFILSILMWIIRGN